jgi:hypothetical protein
METEGMEPKAGSTRRRGDPFAEVLWVTGIFVFLCLFLVVIPTALMRNTAVRTRILNTTIHRYLLAPDWILRISSVDRFGFDGITLRGVRLVHHAESGDQVYAKAARVLVDLDPMPLLSKEIWITRLQIDSPVLRSDLSAPVLRSSSGPPGTTGVEPSEDAGSRSDMKNGGQSVVPAIRVDTISVSGIVIENARQVVARGSVSMHDVDQREGIIRGRIDQIEVDIAAESLRAAFIGGAISGSLTDTMRVSGVRVLAPGIDTRANASLAFPFEKGVKPVVVLQCDLDRITPGEIPRVQGLRIPFGARDSLTGSLWLCIDGSGADMDVSLRGRLFDAPLDTLYAKVSRSEDRVVVEDLWIAHRAGIVEANGDAGAGFRDLRGRIHVEDFDLSDPSLARWTGKLRAFRIAGTVRGSARFGKGGPEIEGTGWIDSLGYQGRSFGPMRFAGRFNEGRLLVDSLNAGTIGAALRASGFWSPHDGVLDARADVDGFPLESWVGMFVRGIPLEGVVSGWMRLNGPVRTLQMTGRLDARDFKVVGVQAAHVAVDSIQGTFAPFGLHAEAAGERLDIYGARMDSARIRMDWNSTMRVYGRARIDSISAATHVTIHPTEPGYLTVDDLRFNPGGLQPWQDAGPMRIAWAKGGVRIDSVRLASPDGRVEGYLSVGPRAAELSGHLKVDDLNLTSLRRFLVLPDSSLEGRGDLDMEIGGNGDRPSFTGVIRARDLVAARWPVGPLRGRFGIESGETIRIDSIEAGVGGGRGYLHGSALSGRIPTPLPAFIRGVKDSLAGYLRRTELSGHVVIDSLDLNQILNVSLGGAAGANARLLAEPLDPMSAKISTSRPGRQAKTLRLAQGIRGRIHALFDISGTGEKPRVHATSLVSNLQVYEARADSLRITASLEPGRAILDSLVWLRDGRSFRAVGEVPVVVSLVPGTTRVLKDEPLKLDAELPDIDLSILGALSRDIQEPAGTLSGSFSLRGTPRRPVPSGSLSVRDGVLRMPNREERLTGIEGTLSIDSSGVVVERLVAREGERGTAEVTGWFTNMNSFDLNAKVRDATVYETGLYTFQASGEFNAYPVISALGSYPLIVGTVDLISGKIIGDLAKVPAAPETRRPRSPWHAEIDVSAPGDIRLQSAVAQVDLAQGDLHVSFLDPDFNIGGGLSVLGGRYRVFNNNFSVREGGTVEFRDLGRGKPEPILDIYADTQVQESTLTTPTTITVHASGPLSQLELTFSDPADPSRPQDDLIALISIGRFTDPQTGSLSVSGISNPGGQYLFTELVSQIETQITQMISPLQGVSVQPGTTPGEAWKLNVRQTVLPQISLGYSRELAQSAAQEMNLLYNLGGVLYLKADVQRPRQTQVNPTDVYSLNLKLHFEYK